MFLREPEDGSVIEIESRDANFLESEFPSKGEILQDSISYKLDKNTPSCPVQEDFKPLPPGNSGSNNHVDDAVPPSHESQTLR